MFKDYRQTLVRNESMLNVMLSHPYFFGFGTLTTFVTVLAQSYLLSFFNQSLMERLELSPLDLASIYSLATLSSALTIPLLGRLIDRYSVIVSLSSSFIAISLGFWGLSLAQKGASLFISFYLIRLFGQAFLSLIPTTMAQRIFGRNRGKGLALIGIGKFVGDGVLPFLMVKLLAWKGFEFTLQLVGSALLFGLLPLVIFLFKKTPQRQYYAESAVSTPLENVSVWSKALKDYRIWIFLISGTIIPFTFTALFFHQIQFQLVRVLGKEVFASGFVTYSFIQFLGLFIVGPLVDRFGATKVFPFALLTFAPSLLIFTATPSILLMHLFYGFAAISISLSSSVRASFWSENFGHKVIGQLRSLDISILVFSTALAPYCAGLILDWGVSEKSFFYLFSGVSLTFFLLDLLIARSYLKERKKHLLEPSR